MISAHHLFKTYQVEPILVDISLNIGAGDRIGLIGPNGSGKTTLLRILSGKEAPDAGVVTRQPASLQIGILDQGFDFSGGATINQLFGGDYYNLSKAEDELVRLSQQLATNPEQESFQAAFDKTLFRLNSLTKQAAKVNETLERLGLGGLSPDQILSQLSGGQKTRLAIARLILDEPDVLLLDEPTNHLDISMLEWLEDWLRKYPGGALIVSHDRTFLDHTVDQIFDLDPVTHGLHGYVGNYSAYLDQYLNAKERQHALYRNQEAEIRRLRQDINRTKQQSLRVELTTTSQQPGVRRYAKKVARKAKSREKKLDRYLESEERVEKPGQSWQMKLQFAEPVHLSQDVLRCEGLGVGYPGSPPLIMNLDLMIKAGERIVLTGPNGGGKTTFLRTIAGELNPIQGNIRLGRNVHLGYMSQEQEGLDPEKSGLEMVQAFSPFNETEARSFLHFYLFSGDEPLRPAGELSYGERSRLSLALLVAQGHNFLLLDEPINHLDIPSRTRFEQALRQFPGTVLAVVHDRFFIDRFATKVWTITEGGCFLEQIRSIP